ncbi:hypothetical protein [Mycobacterium tilburgii]|uniref:hypothetical protein n=1 Tax=Mycobacterium tilburgii TaxID=44467 RepID=UPI0021B18C67|nr:hypothetical protein [Mycobacterium tilburgii]
MGRNHRITDWNPEDAAAWEAGNNKIARRNLFCTIAGDHVAFSIWTLWSVMDCGSQVTLGVLGGMILAAGLLVVLSMVDDRHGGATSIALVSSVVGFLALFVLSCTGNGSVFKPDSVRLRGAQPLAGRQ